MDDYTQNMRLLMQQHTDFKPQFENAFEGYINSELITPKNETLIKIEAKLDGMKEMALAKKEGTLTIDGTLKVLPDVLQP